MKQFIVGDRVCLPLTKGMGCDWEDSIVIKRALALGCNYLFVVSQNDISEFVELGDKENTTLGEMFLFEDVELLTPNSPTCDIFKELRKINEEVQKASQI